MAIFEISDHALARVPETSFGAENLYERRDLQRLLRDNIAVLDDRLLIVAEEFGEWIDSSRRIDLLAIDSNANLVVIELKRTDDGGFMDLQALRYAAMISAMTFDQLIDTFARFRNRAEPDIAAARTTILQFLGWDEPDEGRFGRETRIILGAAEFGKELTTAVMWLNDKYGTDIRCVRLKPYRLATGSVLIDIQQLIPLPEAASFQTSIGVKRQAERQDRAERHDERLRFWDALLKLARPRSAVHANRSPTRDNWISGSTGRQGFSLTYTVRQRDSQVELWIDLGPRAIDRNKAAFHALWASREAIEQAFGAGLEWQELPEGNGCRVRYLIEGGYRTPVDEWPVLQETLVDAMVRLDETMRPRVHALKF